MEHQTEHNTLNDDPRKNLIHLMVPGVILLAVVAVFGSFGNLCIIYAFITRKSSRRQFHFLLAISSLADCMHLSSALVLGYFFVINKPFVNLQTCFIAQIVAIIGSSIGCEILLVIAIDRLISTAFLQMYFSFDIYMYTYKSTYKHKSYSIINYRYKKYCCNHIYLILLLFPIAAHLVYNVFTAYQIVMEHENVQVICFISVFTIGTQLRKLSINVIIFNSLTVLCYICLWFVCRLKTSVTETHRKVLKSLAMISAIMLMGWTTNAVVLVIAETLGLDTVKIFFVRLYFGINVLASCSANYVILYKFSSEYRSAFQKQLSALSVWLSCCAIVNNYCRCKSQVSVVSTSVSRNMP